jgi:hypothetical protein
MEKMNEVATANAHIDVAPGMNEEEMVQNEGRWWNWRVMVNCKSNPTMAPYLS